MEKNNVLVSVSFLPTKEDYIWSRQACWRSVVNRRDVLIARIAGIVVLLGGIAGVVWMSGSFPVSLYYYLAIILGFILCVYHDTVFPFLIRLRAASFFDTHGEQMISQNFLFREDGISIENDRYSARIPYEILYRAYEDRNGFLFSTGIGEITYLPKRAASSEDCRRIHGLLEQNLGQNFKQEGVR